ncbi:hypothetical protein DV736_g1913, partial [Chaetothyriales sp. CBS 134916]
MIPWSSFTGANPHYTDEQFPLRESLLLSHFSATATRISEYEESPMLNNACERRFVLSQFDQLRDHFNAEHIDDIESTIDQLLAYYKYHSPFKPLAYLPASPKKSDLAGLTDTAPPAAGVPEFHLDITHLDSVTPDRIEAKSSSSNPRTDPVARSATLSSDPISTALTPAPQDRLSISCLVNDEPDLSATVPRLARSPTHCCSRVIVPESCSSTPSDTSDQFASLPPLRLTLDSAQGSTTNKRLFSMTDHVSVILSHMLPHETSPSHDSLSDHPSPPLSFKPPYLLPRAASQEGHSRIHKVPRKRRHSPSLDLTGQTLSSKAVITKKARADRPRDMKHMEKETDGSHW